MRAIKVIIWGFGAMGSGMARMLLKKQGIKIVAVLDINPELIGKRISDVLELAIDAERDATIVAPSAEVIKPGVADVVLVATDSFVKATLPRVKQCLEAGLSVISTAEEMAYPRAQSPEEAAELDRLAVAHGATLLGTGINPGFVLDSLILALTGTCEDVTSIYASRVNDLAPFGKAVMHEQGVGISVAEFTERVSDDSLAGHVGFPESVGLIAEGLGVTLPRLEQSKEPIVSTVDRKSTYGEAKAGHVAGIRQQVKAYTEDGACFIHLDHPQQICPQLEGVSTADHIEVNTGNYQVNLTISPEIPGGIGTIAMVVNAIPLVLNADPGLKTMLDLPIPRAIVGDFRDALNEHGRKRLDRKMERNTGDYVVIELLILPSAERAPSLPEETRELDLLARTKGFLQEDARVGDTVTIKTMTGRDMTGTLLAVDPAATHTYGPPDEALLSIQQQVRSLLDELPR